MAYQRYFSYLTATVHKSMFPGLILNQHLTSPLFCDLRASRDAVPKILCAKWESHYCQFKDFGLSRQEIEPTTSRTREGRSDH